MPPTFTFLYRTAYPVLLAGGLLLGSCRSGPEETADVHEAGAPATMIGALHAIAAHSKVLPLGK